MRTACLLALAAIGLSAAEAATYAQVAQVLEARCTECHGASKAKSKLRLDSPAHIRAGGKGGAVIVAQQPEQSRLYTLATLPADHEDRMPPKGERLTAEQLALLKAWIAAGAPMPAE